MTMRVWPVACGACWCGLYLLISAAAPQAARICCWRLEEVDGTHAPNSGTAPACALYAATAGGGPSNAGYIAAGAVTGDYWALAATGTVAQLWAWTRDGSLDSTGSPPAIEAAVTGSFTVLARVLWRDSDWNNVMVSKYSDWDQPGFYVSMRDAAGEKYVVFYVDDRSEAGTLREVLYGPDAGLSGRWVYVAAVRQLTAGANVCRLYVNGALVRTETNGVTGALGNTSPLRLGSIGAADANAFGGALAEAALWDEALAPATVAFYTNKPLHVAPVPPTNAWPLKRLAVYYGYPSQINNAGGILAAAAYHFAPYDSIVLGEGLEEPTHEDHAFTDQLIDLLTGAGKEVYGYVDLGVSTRNHSYATLTNKMSLWRAMGATGIFLDDYGYDYGTSRVRQTNAVAHAHRIGCNVCANAWVPADAFDTNYDAAYNPERLPTPLTADDVYLAESFVIETGAYDQAANWIEKSRQMVQYSTQTGARIFCLTSSTSTNEFTTAKWWYACDAAIAYGFAAIGWGEPEYASGTQRLPWRASPSRYIGTALVARADGQMPTNSMYTDEGRFFLDTLACQSGFEDTVTPRVASNVFVWPYAQCVAGEQRYEVQWRADGIYDYGLTPTPITLMLIWEDGEKTMAEGAPNSGSWTWYVTSLENHTNCRMILRATDAAGHSTWQTSSVFSVAIPESGIGVILAVAAVWRARAR